MISYSEVVERAITGPRCTETDFDLRIFSKTLNDTIKEFLQKGLQAFEKWIARFVAKGEIPLYPPFSTGEF